MGETNLTAEEIDSLKRQLRGWNRAADDAARSIQTADRDFRTAEDNIGRIEAELRRAGVNV
jgi:chromosome segregation ATPase